MRLLRNQRQESSSPNLAISSQPKDLPLSRRVYNKAFQAASQLLYVGLALASLHIVTSDAETLSQAPANEQTATSMVVSVQQGQATQDYTLPVDSRLSQVMMQVELSDNDYWYAMAWLRPTNQAIYQDKKTQLLALIEQQMEQDKYAEQWRLVKQQVSAIIPTNRYTVPVHPDRVFAAPEQNYLLKAHDQLVIPTRPSTVHMTGFIPTQQLAHQPKQDITKYLRAYQPFDLADNSYVWLIKPDSSIQQLPIAYWNKQQSQPIAPGSIIYVPAKSQLFSTQYQQINQLYLELLQNQYIGSAQGE
ncbi:capsule biosynthesis GfcC family protein [Agarivorans sp. QJM3NY_33]|uniref:capsule biosynthesis GfcC family protein n=1 Tax=Agarivorans sp. QJM3NY_33 TaxID=3421432 RepID=UPI003D7CFDFD